MITYIYALIEESKKSIDFRYIGQTQNTKQRLCFHKTSSSNEDLKFWLTTSSNARLIILQTLDTPNKVEVSMKERLWIERLKPRYNLHHSTTRNFRVVAGRLVPFKAKTLSAIAANHVAALVKAVAKKQKQTKQETSNAR